MTTVPGSSKVVVGGVVAYQTRAKREVLGLAGVNDLNVVSYRTAIDMARAVRGKLRADYGVSTTGYLDGDDPHAWYAIYGPPLFQGHLSATSEVVRFPKPSPREKNREILVSTVFDALIHVVCRDDPERESR
jgi:nicotinamide mononucleotide (NMN) deamidase PncC